VPTRKRGVVQHDIAVGQAVSRKKISDSRVRFDLELRPDGTAAFSM
jgi:hypothetical protein